MKDTTTRSEQQKSASTIRMQVRLALQKECEREQEEEDRKALRLTPEQWKLLRDTFACVKYEPEDLDGLSWNTPAAQKMLAEMNARQALRDAAEAELTNANSQPGGVSDSSHSPSAPCDSDMASNAVVAPLKEEQSTSPTEPSPVDAGVVSPSIDKSETSGPAPTTPPGSPPAPRHDYFYLDATPKPKHQIDDDDEDVERTPLPTGRIRTDDSKVAARERSREDSTPSAFDIMETPKAAREPVFSPPPKTSPPKKSSPVFSPPRKFTPVFSPPPRNKSSTSISRPTAPSKSDTSFLHPFNPPPKVFSPPPPGTQFRKAKASSKPSSGIIPPPCFSPPNSPSLKRPEASRQRSKMIGSEGVFSFEPRTMRERSRSPSPSPSPAPGARRAASSSSPWLMRSVLKDTSKLNEGTSSSALTSWAREEKGGYQDKGRGVHTTRAVHERNGVERADEVLLSPGISDDEEVTPRPEGKSGSS